MNGGENQGGARLRGQEVPPAPGDASGGPSPAGDGPSATPPPSAPPLRVFTEEALRQLREREEPPTAGEAELAGPWRVRRIAPGRFGVFRHGDQEAGEPPLGVFAERHLALLAAVAFPGLGRSPVFRVHPEAGGSGYPLLRDGVEVGTLAPFLADLAPALDALEAVIRSPGALALVLEAAGPTALELAGRALGLRLVSPAAEEGV